MGGQGIGGGGGGCRKPLGGWDGEQVNEHRESVLRKASKDWSAGFLFAKDRGFN